MHEYEILEHHGVKGMKWGVRRDRKGGGIKKAASSFKKSRALTKESRKRERSWSKAYKKRGRMSDDELRNALNRLRMENEFARLATEATASQRKKTKAYISAVSNLPVDKSGTTLKSALAKQVVKKATVAAASAL